MRIAVTYENGQVFQHFGHTERFQIYDVEKGKVVLITTVNTNGSSHGALPDILKKLQVNKVICGDIGDGAQRALAEANIELYGGVSCNTEKAVAELLAGKLSVNSKLTCDHQGEHHDHRCGESGCNVPMSPRQKK